MIPKYSDDGEQLINCEMMDNKKHKNKKNQHLRSLICMLEKCLATKLELIDFCAGRTNNLAAMIIHNRAHNLSIFQLNS